MISDDELHRLTSKYDIGNVPGYLSYPAVGMWKAPVAKQDIERIFTDQISSRSSAYLYFHFPYCETLCYYCACYMKVTADPKTRYDDYIGFITGEMEQKLDRLHKEKIRVGQMHWGGGTPTYMSCEQIERVFREIEKRVEWTADATLSLEAYPDARTLSDEKIDLLARLGFNQISFGIESLDPKVLEAINRRHDIESIRHWVGKARERNFGVHVDLVYGLPHQTPESFRDTVEGVLSIKPDRLATFSFMYTPLAIPHQRAIPRAAVPDSTQRYRLYEILQKVAAEAGYERVGVDHWVLAGTKDPLAQKAKLGEIIYHFQGYEPLDRETFLGFGSSAVSFAGHRYFQNTQSINDYGKSIIDGQLPVIAEKSALLSEDDRIRHRVIMKHLMSDLRIDLDAIEREFGINFDAYFADALVRLREMQQDALVEGVGTRIIQVTALGRAFIRNIANAFDRYYHALDPQVAALAG